MQLSVTGKQIDVGDALRTHVASSLDAILDKYFGAAIEAHVVFAREAHLIRAELAIHIGRGIVVNGHAAAENHYAAFDIAAEHIAKQLRRYKRRLRDHHQARQAAVAGAIDELARSYVLAPIDDEAEREPASEIADTGGGATAEAGTPVVIAENATELPRLTVGEAVMRLDLADTPVLLFRSRAHGEINLVYRRGDGNIGWIEPELDPAPRSRNR
jgi:ribosomal subunit interface protein